MNSYLAGLPNIVNWDDSQVIGLVVSGTACLAYTSLWSKNLNIQWCLSITWPYMCRFFIVYSFMKGWMLICLWTHNRHPISCPDGQAMGCLLWVFCVKLVVWRRNLTVSLRIFCRPSCVCSLLIGAEMAQHMSVSICDRGSHLSSRWQVVWGQLFLSGIVWI